MKSLIKKNLRITSLAVETKSTKEFYLIGLKHNISRKEFYRIADFNRKISGKNPITSELIINFINNAPEKFNFKAVPLTDDEKKEVEETLRLDDDFKNMEEIAWK